MMSCSERALASLPERCGYDVMGQAGDGTGLLALARETRPELVVAYIRMPLTHTTEGLEAARVIRQELPDTAILVLSAYAEVEHAMDGTFVLRVATGRAQPWLRPSGRAAISAAVCRNRERSASGPRTALLLPYSC
jgi:CheY-like chemotaxis protein